MKTITVLAGGWSASHVDLHRLPGIVIAVNDSAIYAPRIDIVISMDRLWTENRFAQVSSLGKPVWLRRRTLRNVRWETQSCVTAFECDHTSVSLSDQPGRLDGGHSGFCAINLAYLMRPQQLYLIGFDSALGPKGEKHWFPDYPWKGGGGSKAAKLATWSSQYTIAAKQLKQASVAVFHHCIDQRRDPTPFHSVSAGEIERAFASLQPEEMTT